MIAATKGFIGRAGLILAVCLPLLSTQAHAVSVTVNGTNYELSVVNTSYNANTGLLQGQTWWGDGSLASQFASAAGNIGGTFAFGTYDNGIASVSGYGFYDYGGSLTGVANVGFAQSTTTNYVTATASASSVPEINAGSLSQALLILFALWLVTRRDSASRVA